MIEDLAASEFPLFATTVATARAAAEANAVLIAFDADEVWVPPPQPLEAASAQVIARAAAVEFI